MDILKWYDPGWWRIGRIAFTFGHPMCGSRSMGISFPRGVMYFGLTPWWRMPRIWRPYFEIYVGK